MYLRQRAREACKANPYTGNFNSLSLSLLLVMKRSWPRRDRAHKLAHWSCKTFVEKKVSLGKAFLRNRRGAMPLTTDVGRKSVRGNSLRKREQAIYPGLGGASNWESPFCSPVTGQMYVPVLNRGTRIKAKVTAQWPLGLSEERAGRHRTRA